MDLLVDTFSWKKFDMLSENDLFDISYLYEWAAINITHEVGKEIRHFKLNSCLFNQVKILPILNRAVYQDARDLGFDIADSEVVSNGQKSLDLIIVSEDRPLLKFAMAYSFSIIQVADMFKLFTQVNLLEKRDLTKIVRFLREKRNISEKKRKQIKKWQQHN